MNATETDTTATDNRILVVAAHPDDEVLGCGATVALRVAQGWTAQAVIMTRGVTGREVAETTQDPAAIAAQAALGKEMRRAGEVIGFAEVTQLDFPDNRMDRVSRQDLCNGFAAIVQDFRPTEIFTHHPGDYNWDHGLTFDAVMMAARVNPPDDYWPDRICTFEVPSSTERAPQDGVRSFHPNYYVEVDKTIDIKKLAMTYYASESRPYPHPRSIEGLEYTARRRGLEIGASYAEAFCMVRGIERASRNARNK